jgi:hypothetical protein
MSAVMTDATSNATMISTGHCISFRHERLDRHMQIRELGQ